MLSSLYALVLIAFVAVPSTVLSINIRIEPVSARPTENHEIHVCVVDNEVHRLQDATSEAILVSVFLLIGNDGKRRIGWRWDREHRPTQLENGHNQIHRRASTKMGNSG